MSHVDWARWRAALGRVLAPFLLSRVWVALFVYLAHMARPFLAPVVGGWEGIPHWWLNPWTTYDSFWFVTLAQHGYTDPAATVFFPLYPAFLSLAGDQMVPIVAWGVLSANLLFLVALVLLYRLTEQELGASVAWVAVWLLAFYPTTIFFSAVYTESFFLCWFLGAFYAARQGRWLLAGALAAVAAMTRNSGLLMAGALFLLYARSLGYQWRAARWRPLLGLALPVLAFGAVQAWFAAQVGGALPSLAMQESATFARSWTWPWLPLWWDAQDVVALRGVSFASPFDTFVTGLPFYGILFLNLAFTLLALALTLRYARRLPLAYHALTLGILAMHLTLARSFSPYTIGTVRYLSTTFPFIMLLACALLPLRHRPFLRIGALLAIGLTSAISSYLVGLKLFLG